MSVALGGAPAPASTVGGRRWPVQAIAGTAVAVLGATVFLDVADLALALRGRWSGRGR